MVTRLGAAAGAALLSLAMACTSSVDERVAEARRQAEAGDVPGAIRMLRSALEDDPGHVAANHLLGIALLQSGDISRAVPRLQRSVEDPGFAQEAGLALATAFFQGQNFEEAIAAAGEVLAIHADHPEALRVRATARIKVGDAEGCVEDTTRALRSATGDSALLVLTAGCLARLERLDEAEAALESAVAVTRAAKGPLRGNACAALADFHDSQRKNPERAETIYRACLVRDPAHASLLQAAGAFFERIERPDAALEIVEDAVVASPDDLRLQRIRAGLLVEGDRADEGRQALDALAERLDTAQAWSVAGAFRRELGDPDGAAQALARAIERSPDDAPSLRFARADALIDSGRLDEAEQIAAELSPDVFAHLIRGRLLLVRGDAAGALAEFELGLASWPNNAGARFLAGQAAERLGDPRRATSEYREATRAEPDATDAALYAARVALQMGRPTEAMRFAQRHVANRVGSHGLAAGIAARARAALGDAAGAREALDGWLTQHGADPDALAALVELPGISAEDASRRIAESGLDLAEPQNESALRALVELELRGDRAAEAGMRVERALAAQPESATLHDLHARVLDAQGDAAGAAAAVARALERDPEYGPALEASGRLHVRNGDLEGGLALLDQATAVRPQDPEPAYAAAQLALGAGRPDARTRLETLVSRHPTHAGAANDLAWLLAESGQDLDRALLLAQRAVSKEDDPAMLDTLGWVYLQRGEPQKAGAVLQKAVDKDPALAGALYRLGLATLRSGEREAAAQHLRAALATGGFPEAEAARAELVRLEASAD